MKEKLLIISIFVVLLLSGCGKSEEESTRTLNNYKANEVCKKHIVDEVEGETFESDSNVYLIYDEFNFVKSAIYQSVATLDSSAPYSREMYERIRNIYSSIDGVNVIYYDTKDSLVLEVRYDYDKIDLSTFRTKLGDLLDKDSLLGSAKTIPVTIEKFKSIELDGYECEEK